MILTTLRSLSFLALTATAASAQTIGPANEWYEAGVICPSTGNDVPTLPFVTRTSVVPAVPGMSFGGRAVTTEAIGPVRAQVILTHPPFAGGGTLQTFEMTFSPTQLGGFHDRFDTPGELVPGLWRRQAQPGGKILFSIDFDVVTPAANDVLMRACGL